LAENILNAPFLTGLGLNGFLKASAKGQELQAAGGYQQYVTQESIRVYYVPSRHWEEGIGVTPIATYGEAL